MYLRSLLPAIIVLMPALVYAQTVQTIRGKVTTTTNTPVLNAKVALEYTKDSTVIKSVRTNQSGGYELVSNRIASTRLRAEAQGYATQVKQINDTVQGGTVNFILQKNTSLGEVVITTRKPVFEQKVDRTVFNVENSITATGGDAWDALKKTPGVLIMNNQVTIAGKSSAGVMINGRMQQLSGDDLAQLLHSIPTGNLSKIEVITSPPARYDAEGNAGIINIITKTSLKQGLKGSATASYNRNSFGSPSLSTSLNYRREKLNVYANANMGILAWKYTNRTTTHYEGQSWVQRLDQGSFNKNARVQAGADYNITKSAIIGIIVSEGYNKIDNEDSISAVSMNSYNIDSVIHTRGETHDLYKGKHTVNVNYEWKIDSTGKKLNIDVDYYGQKGTRKRDFDVNNYRTDGATTAHSDNRITASPAIDIRSVKADVEWPAKIANFSFGAKASDVTNKADNIYETRTNAGYVTDPAKTNAFEYREQIQAAYFSGKKAVGKYEFQLGIRAEHTKTKGYSATLAQTNVNEYTQLFPSGYMQYTPNKNHSFNINYNRRISRPAYNSLNPFRFYYTSTAYAEGNPNLQPSYRHGLEIGYALQSKYYIKVSGSKTSNYWDRVIETDTLTGGTRTTRANLGNAAWLSVSFSTTINPAKWWESRIGISAEHNAYTLTHFNGSTFLSSYYAWFETNNSFYLDKKQTLSAELYGYYYTPRQKDYKRWDNMSCVNIGIRKLLMNKNLVLALNFDDIFAKTFWYQTNVANGTTEYSYDDERSVRFAVTYKFGNKNVKVKRDRNTTTDEMQRASQQ